MFADHQAGKWEEETKDQAYEQLLKTTRNECNYAAAKGMNVELEMLESCLGTVGGLMKEPVKLDGYSPKLFLNCPGVNPVICLNDRIKLE